MKRVLAVVLAFAGVGCGPLAIGAGVSTLFDNGSSDPTSPTLTIAAHEPSEKGALLTSGAYVTFRVRDEENRGAQPTVTTLGLRFVITPNKAGISTTALLESPAGTDIPVDLTPVPGSLDVSVEIFSDQLVDGPASPSCPPGDGAWIFKATGIDSKGRIGTAEFSFIVDRCPPVLPPVPIRAQAREPGTVLLEWLPTTEPGVVGYRIYEAVGGTKIPDVRDSADRGRLYAENKDAGICSLPVEVPGGRMATSYVQGGLLGTRNYYFQVVAVDAAGNESPLSDAGELAARTRSGGTGVFGTPTTANELKVSESLPAGGDMTTSRLAVADLDGNRKPDFVIGAESTLYVVSDAGSVTPIDVGFTTFAFRVGDVTNDRIPDIVVADTSVPPNPPAPAGISVWKGRGDGTFDLYLDASSLPQDTYNTRDEQVPEQATDLVITDLDDDGFGDFVTFVDTGPGQKQELHWFRDVDTSPGGDAIELIPFAEQEGGSFAIADLDGDGTKDLIGGLEQNVFVRRGAVLDPSSNPAAFAFAHGAFNQALGSEGFVGAGGDVLSVEALDLNGDGKRDLLCALANGQISIIENIRLADELTLVLAPAKVITVGTGDVRVATGDFNADGLPDIAAADLGRGAVTILLSRRGGQLDYRISQVFAVPGLADIAVVDRNGDGLLDIALATGAGSIEFWFGHGSIGRGDGGFAEAGSPFSAHLEIGPAADLNGDGIVDILAAAVDQNFTMQTILGNGYQGQGDGTFTFGPSSQNLSVKFRTGLALGDIDNNGELDFFGNAGYNIEVYASTFPTFQRSLAAKTSTGIVFADTFEEKTGGFVRVPAVADVNRDRFADLVMPWSDGEADLFLSIGSPQFFPATNRPLSFSSPHRWDSVVVTDINGDGRKDIVSMDTDVGYVRFLLGDAFGNFTENGAPEEVATTLGHVDNPGQSSPTLLVADLNRDGFPDLAAVNSLTPGVVAVALGSSGGFQTAYTITVDENVELRDLHAADIDGDGLLDLIATASGTTYALLQAPQEPFSLSVKSSPVSAQVKDAGVHAAVIDFNGDSIPDLVVGNSDGMQLWMGTGEVVTFPPPSTTSPPCGP